MLEFLKGLFNGQALTFEELQNAAGQSNIKAVNLADGGYVAQAKYDDAVGAKDKTIAELNQKIAEKDQSMADLGGEIEKQVNAVRSEYEEKLRQEQYKSACREYAHEKGFNSAAARNWFVESIIKKNLGMKDGEIVGADDYFAEYKAKNEDSFSEEAPPPGVNRKKNPPPPPKAMTLEERMMALSKSKERT